MLEREITKSIMSVVPPFEQRWRNWRRLDIFISVMEKARSFQQWKNAKTCWRLQFEQMKEPVRSLPRKLLLLDCYEADEFIAPLVGIGWLFVWKRIRWRRWHSTGERTTSTIRLQNLNEDPVRRPIFIWSVCQWFLISKSTADEEFSASITAGRSEVRRIRTAPFTVYANHIKSWKCIIEYTISVAEAIKFFYKVYTIAQTTKNIWVACFTFYKSIRSVICRNYNARNSPTTRIVERSFLITSCKANLERITAFLNNPTGCRLSDFRGYITICGRYDFSLLKTYRKWRPFRFPIKWNNKPCGNPWLLPKQKFLTVLVLICT